MEVTITVNGTAHTLDIEPRLRELALEYGVDPDEAVRIATEIMNKERRRSR